MLQPTRITWAAVLACAFAIALVAASPAYTSKDLMVYFSPDGGCTDAVVTELNKATKQIRVQAYSFTSTPIAKAILDAKKRKVDVQIILDKSNRTDRYSAATFLNNEGLSPLIDAEHAIAHNKIIIIDGATVITGSFNFTKSAEESNAENLLIIRRPDVAKAYLANWEEHKRHAEVYAKQ